MITFKRRALWDKIRCIYPPYRREQDARIEAAISVLIDDPSMPCNIEGEIIPNGYGGQNLF